MGPRRHVPANSLPGSGRTRLGYLLAGSLVVIPQVSFFCLSITYPAMEWGLVVDYHCNCSRSAFSSHHINTASSTNTSRSHLPKSSGAVSPLGTKTLPQKSTRCAASASRWPTLPSFLIRCLPRSRKGKKVLNNADGFGVSNYKRILLRSRIENLQSGVEMCEGFWTG